MRLLKSLLRIAFLTAVIIAIFTWPLYIPQTISDDDAPIINKVAKSVYKITPIDNAKAGGTGFQISTTRGPMILSNAHVCESIKENVLRAWQGRKYWDLPILEISDKTDLCLIKGIPGQPVLALGAPASSLDKITIIGHPWLMPVTPSQGWVIDRKTIDIATSKTEQECTGYMYEWKDYMTWLGPQKICFRSIESVRTNVRMFPGNSGSPIVNSQGQVVGVAFAINSFFRTSYYIPIYDVYAFVKKYEVLTDLEENPPWFQGTPR